MSQINSIKEWREVSLGDIFKFSGGGTPDKSNPSYWHGEIRWASVKDVKGQYLTDTIDSITEKGLGNSSTKMAHPGDVILITRISPGLTVLPQIPVAINQDLKVIVPPVEMSPKFISSLFQTLKRKIIDLSSGTTVLGIRLNLLDTITFGLPPLHEQTRIVEILDELFSELDAGVASLESARAQLKVYRQAVLCDAFEGKLTEAWRAEHMPESAEVLLEQIKHERTRRYQEQLDDWEQAVKDWEDQGKTSKKPTKPKQPKDLPPLTKAELADLPELPKGWCWTHIGKIATVSTGGTPLTTNSKYYRNGTIPWVTSGALNSSFVDSTETYITELALKETNVKLFPAQTLLIAMYGEGKTRGKCSELKIEATTNQAIAALLQNESEAKIRRFTKLFLEYSYDKIRFGSVGGVQPNLNLGKVSNIKLPLCSLAEQYAIVESIETRLSVVEKIESTIEEHLQKAEALRQSILKQAFEGKLTAQWREEHPDLITGENSAQALIERIQAEKAKRNASTPKLKPKTKRKIKARKAVSK